MNPSLSVILPVCSAAESLERVVGRLLEMLPDLTGRFEILIVDDASTDNTPEIADELRRTYPQVRVIRHGWSWGTAAALRTGRRQCRGRHVIVVPALADFHPREIVRQWELLTSEAVPERFAEALPQPPVLRRSEPAHDEPRRQREPSFLRHLRQLSAGA
ncbi:MAG TPA: glycosyltransferase family 2 protein [Pirellulaceae bacterium]|nr:glycosyltransferase family 2 protein [Pirellulaceae bacterium]